MIQGDGRGERGEGGEYFLAAERTFQKERKQGPGIIRLVVLHTFEKERQRKEEGGGGFAQTS